MKGIILAGGSGTRLYPITKGISKQLLPIYDKPMIYYPMSVLMLAGIREICIISNPEYIDNYKMIFGDGSDFGLEIDFKVQYAPKGIAEAFVIAEDFIEDDSVCLILGDNVFYGQGFSSQLENVKVDTNSACIFGYYVNNPESFGVVDFDEKFNVLSLEEKPANSKSNYAIPGLYFYGNSVIKKAMNLTPGSRGELEITDLNKKYLEEGNLQVSLLGRGLAWLDTGTFEGLASASNFVETIQKRTGLYVACLEEIAYSKGWISRKHLLSLAEKLSFNDYGKYLKSIGEK